MSKFLTYNPQSVMIPPDIATRHSDLLRHTNDSYPSDLATNGGYVLLHDVFRTINDDKILAIGTGWRDVKQVPFYDHRKFAAGWYKKELYKLKNDLAPINVEYAGEQLKFKYRTVYGNYPEFSNQKFAPVMGVYEIEMTPEMSSLDEVRLKLIWHNFSVELKVPRNIFKSPKTDLTLHASQRGNHPLWVSDWCRYYHNQHGVKRVVIYNNLDNDSDMVAKALRELPDQLEVIYINWPYRYHNEIYFNGTQVIGYNHCWMLLSDTSKYYLNFDFDEYLINTTELTLTQFLNSKTEGWRRASTIAVRQWRVPYFSQELGTDELPRVWHFKHCSRFGTSKASPKTINMYGRFECVWQHTVTPRWPKYYQYLLRNRRLVVYMGKLQSVFPYFRYTLTIWPKRAIVIRLLNFGKKIPIVNKFVDVLLTRLKYNLPLIPDLYFYHYDAIGTNWTTRRPNRMTIVDGTVSNSLKPIKKSQIY